MKIILLTKGHFAQVSDEDYADLNAYKWYYHNKGYAARYLNDIKQHIFMHNVVANTPDDKEADHINHDKLDNRRENLRNATKSQNLGNRLVNKNSTTGYKGVLYHKINENYIARIQIGKSRKFLGSYATAIAAAIAYNNAAIKYFGEYAYLNEVK